MRSTCKPVLIIVSCLLLLLSITGCNLTSTYSNIENKSSLSAPAALSQEEQTSLEEVFPKDKVIDVKITIDEAEFQDMLDNASREEYKEASVNYNGKQFDHVGIRIKGNLSLRSVVNSDSDRYSFKISFDEYVNQQYNGISKINLNNNYSDASYMREFLTYELAASVGLPTPGFSYVNVYVNEELWGFYLAVEQIDEAYLKRNFETTSGALYKAEMTGSGSDLTWLGDNLDAYTGLVQKSEKSNNDILINMLDELNNGSNYEKVLNIDNALKYIALNVAASNMDSYLGQNKQNYYLYEDQGIFNILPWDYNMAFGGFGGSNLLIDEPTQGAVADRPLVAKLLAVDEYKKQYHQVLSEMISGYLSEEHITSRIQEVKALISSQVQNDPRPFYSYEEYEQSLETLTTFIKNNVDNITKQLNGTLPSSGDGSGSGGGMGPGGGNRGMGGQRMNLNNTADKAPANNTDAIPNNNAVPNMPNASNSTTVPGAKDTEIQQNAQQNVQPEPIGGGANNGKMGGGFPEGFPGGGGFKPDGFNREETNQEGGSREAIYTGIALLLLLLSSLFVTLYKRKRL
ncbi:CotH kinase family protein [Paenibacillus dakarensis]|uniref:CotH kinase family protein n=1 Tax=Paenibacillus dakarensis TaxID=1527293 RepID=UPI0006D5A6F2|nr:CotH kinase family protein [Paenibacillus dakarensis]